ncbi:MAG: membrane protein [Gaiellaceae bacterium]|nr:MAG: membrane protein [Gaiellaceae bacterium]
MARLTGLVLRYRWAVVAGWTVVAAVSLVASAGVSELLTSRVTLPGTDTSRAEAILEEHFGQSSNGRFTVVVEHSGGAAVVLPELARAAARGAAQVRTGRVVDVVPLGPDLAAATIATTLSPAEAKRYTPRLRAAVGSVAGATTWITGPPAIEHDLDPVLRHDLRVGELLIAVPIALVLLVVTFGTLSFLVPFAFALCTIPTTLGIVWALAHVLELNTYIPNMVSLLGLAIAIDYSLLVVYRFREELAAGRDTTGAVLVTMDTAGRAVVFSGTAVALGLSLLLFMPLPFMRGFGIAGLLLPSVSVVAALTLLPVLLSLVGRPLERVRVLPASWLARRDDHERGFWVYLARAIMRRPKAVALITTASLLLLAAPVLTIELGPGSNEGVPERLESIQGLRALSAVVGDGALAPTEVVVDTGAAGGADTAEVRRALERLLASLRTDPEVSAVVFDPSSRQHVDPTGRYLVVSAIGKDEYGKPDSLAFVERLRQVLVPGAAFPETARVYAGGGPPAGRDFLDLLYGWFPWLALGVLAATYILLVRAFRSLLVPLKAIVLDLLSIAAACGLLVLVFEHGAAEWIGLIAYDQIEGWIPVLVFAVLFGLSMDYEVFLVSRMREEWDRGASNEEAIVLGLTRTGRLVTAAGLIMFAAFTGFVAGSVVGLQQFGFGLAAAVLIDVTVVRALLVPSAMKLFGHWNWWLPESAARLLRVEPSSLRSGGQRPNPHRERALSHG